MFLIGAGMAFAFTSVQTASFATISSEQTGQASALFNAQRQIGGSLGIALLSSVISGVGMTQLGTNGATVPNFTAYHAAFLAAAVLALIAACIGLAVFDSDASSTMRRSTQQAKQEVVPKKILDVEQTHVALNQEAD